MQNFSFILHWIIIVFWCRFSIFKRPQVSHNRFYLTQLSLFLFLSLTHSCTRTCTHPQSHTHIANPHIEIFRVHWFWCCEVHLKIKTQSEVSCKNKNHFANMFFAGQGSSCPFIFLHKNGIWTSDIWSQSDCNCKKLHCLFVTCFKFRRCRQVVGLWSMVPYFREL